MEPISKSALAACYSEPSDPPIQPTMARKPRSRLTNDMRPIGADCIGVVLQTGHLALFDREAIEDLQRQGTFGRMFLTGNGTGLHYVCMKEAGLGHTRTVARLIAQASPEEDVRFANGDRLDLRRANLRIVPKDRARRIRTLAETARTYFPNDPRAQDDWMELKVAEREAKRRFKAEQWERSQAVRARRDGGLSQSA